MCLNRQRKRYGAIAGWGAAFCAIVVHASMAMAQDDGGDPDAPSQGEPSSEPPTEVPEPPPPAPQPPPPEAAAEEGAAVEEIQIDAIIPTARRERALWQVQGLYELHLNLVSDDRSGNDWLAWYMLRGDLNLTVVDQVSLRMDLEQRFIADPGESGLFFGDMRFYYSRAFTMPVPDFPIPAKAAIYLTAPTSRISRERGIITEPTASLTLAPSLGPFTLFTTGLFRYSFARWAESSQGDPNSQITTGYTLQLYYIPFDWFAPSIAWQQLWAVPYETREGDGQPANETYYLEIALNFSVPMPEQAPSLDLSLAYAQGASVLEDGVYRLYFAKRDQSEIYFGMNLTY